MLCCLVMDAHKKVCAMILYFISISHMTLADYKGEETDTVLHRYLKILFVS